MTKCLRASTPARLAVFGSAYPGEATLREVSEGSRLADTVDVVGVIRDDPKNPRSNAANRTWKYLDTEDLPIRVERLATEHGIPTFLGDLGDKRFQETFITEWRPDLIISAFFGQKVPYEYRSVARLGAINTHPCAQSPFDVWPTPFAGTLPITRMLEARNTTLHWAAHFMTSVFDSGPLIACSQKLRIAAPDATVPEIYEQQATHQAKFVADLLAVLTGACSALAVAPPDGYACFGPHNGLESIQSLNPIRATNLTNPSHVHRPDPSSPFDLHQTSHPFSNVVTKEQHYANDDRNQHGTASQATDSSSR